MKPSVIAEAQKVGAGHGRGAEGRCPRRHPHEHTAHAPMHVAVTPAATTGSGLKTRRLHREPRRSASTDGSGRHMRNSTGEDEQDARGDAAAPDCRMGGVRTPPSGHPGAVSVGGELASTLPVVAGRIRRPSTAPSATTHPTIFFARVTPIHCLCRDPLSVLYAHWFVHLFFQRGFGKCPETTAITPLLEAPPSVVGRGGRSLSSSRTSNASSRVRTRG